LTDEDESLQRQSARGGGDILGMILKGVRSGLGPLAVAVPPKIQCDAMMRPAHDVADHVPRVRGEPASVKKYDCRGVGSPPLEVTEREAISLDKPLGRGPYELVFGRRLLYRHSYFLITR
jgi:hypothetical protein